MTSSADRGAEWLRARREARRETGNVVHLPARDDAPTVIPDGAYDLACDGHDVVTMFRVPRVVIRFRVVGGDYDGQTVARYYRVRRADPATGQIVVGRSSDMLREYARMFDEVPRLDRIPMSRYADCIIRGRVRAVCADHRGRELHRGLRYSVVAELLGVVR